MADRDDTSPALLDMKCLQKVVEQVIVLEEKNNSSRWDPIARAEERTDGAVGPWVPCGHQKVMGRASEVSQHPRHLINNQPNGQNGARNQTFVGCCLWSVPQYPCY